MEETKRIDEVDILKGIGIILMITGHIEFGSVYDKWIHSFHMPMFFIISGFLFHVKDVSLFNFIKRKSKPLLIPYFLFALIHYLFWIILCLIKNNLSISNLLNPLEHIFFINTSGMPIAGALWFLTSLFLVEIIYFIILKNFSSSWRRFLVFIFSILGCIIPKYFRLPFGADISFMAIGLFEIGYALKMIYEKKTIEYKSFSFIFIILASIICFFNGYVNVRNGEYSNVVLYYSCASLMTIGLFCICKIWTNNTYLKSELKFVGKNSIVYVCLNQLVLLVPNKLSLICTNFYILFINKFIIFIFTMITLHIFVAFINKYCKWILGK